MSIATLKKKTQNLYNSHSVGNSGFSINGTRRSQGWVGQTMLSRSLPRTLARGNTLRGHGGLNGSYNDNLSITSGLVDKNNSSVVKSSVLGTNGMLDTHFRWVRRPFPFSATKPDSNLNNNFQSIHTSRLANCTIDAVKVSNPTGAVRSVFGCSVQNAKYMIPSYNKLEAVGKLCEVTKTTETSTINTYNCGVLNVKNQSSVQRGPIP